MASAMSSVAFFLLVCVLGQQLFFCLGDPTAAEVVVAPQGEMSGAGEEAAKPRGNEPEESSEAFGAEAMFLQDEEAVEGAEKPEEVSDDSEEKSYKLVEVDDSEEESEGTSVAASLRGVSASDLAIALTERLDSDYGVKNEEALDAINLTVLATKLAKLTTFVGMPGVKLLGLGSALAAPVAKIVGSSPVAKLGIIKLPPV